LAGEIPETLLEEWDLARTCSSILAYEIIPVLEENLSS
jgi:hypothetical protein